MRILAGTRFSKYVSRVSQDLRYLRGRIVPIPMPLSVGDRLGPYEILAPIGAGGMGEVYRAHDTKLARNVAIKVLPAALAQDRERLARFKREAKVLASLN